jgi:HAD superfamily hydrolase (TIGR01549 family)
MPLRGVIFDLDGTLVDSGLDFDAIRADLNFAPKQPILETVDRLPLGAEKDRCLAILREHELRGAQRATLMPGIAAFLATLSERSIKTGILTRNSRESTDITLSRLQLNLQPVLTRDDVPAKPDPTGLLKICQIWGCGPDEAIYVGDYLFDIQAGRNARMRTVLYTPANPPDYAHLADHTLNSFHDAIALLERLA